MRDSIKDPKNAAFKDFENQLDTFEEKSDLSGILDYLLSLRNELVQLQVTHKNTPITIQRVILLILPIIEKLDEEATGNKGK